MLDMILKQLEGTVNDRSLNHAQINEVQVPLCGLVQVIMIRVGSNIEVPKAE